MTVYKFYNIIVFVGDEQYMNTKEEVLRYIKNIFTENNISIYSIAKITGINRSTLQKALSGNRSLNLRQFKLLIDCLPLSVSDKTFLYEKYEEYTCGNGRVTCNNCILDILNEISNVFESTHYNSTPRINNSSYGAKTIFVGDDIFDYISTAILSKVNSSDEVCVYLPFTNNFFTTAVHKYLVNGNTKLKFSILFDFINKQYVNNANNLIILKNIIPLILGYNSLYQFNYNYSDNDLIDKMATPFPYYIALSDKLILINAKINKIAVINDIDIINMVRDNHFDTIKKASPLVNMELNLESCVSRLMQNQISDDDAYSISYEPCITSFIPPHYYEQLITDEYPNKADFIQLIYDRLAHIKSINTRYTLFNKDSIIDFAKTGNPVAYKNPYFRCCTPEQRKEILKIILKQMEDKHIIMRAFSSNDINISKRFEINSIQNFYNFSILIYRTNGTVNMIEINEPTISKQFINFFHDITETYRTYTFEETKQLLVDTISQLDKMI